MIWASRRQSPGAGKSTLAAILAEHLCAHRIDLDALWWTPGWVHVAPEQLAAQVSDRIAQGEPWVVDGCYLEQVGRQVWSSADTLLWLDLPRRLTFGRVIHRSLRRRLRRETIHNGNREQLAALGPRSLLDLWRRIPGYRSEILALLNDPATAHLDVVRLSSADEIEQWVHSVVPDRPEPL